MPRWDYDPGKVGIFGPLSATGRPREAMDCSLCGGPFDAGSPYYAHRDAVMHEDCIREVATGFLAAERGVLRAYRSH